MAATLTLEALILIPRWPGVAVPPPIPVTDITSAGAGHNLALAMWPVGTRWELYCSGDQVSVGVSYRQGFTDVVYLQAGPDAASATASVRTVICVPDETIAAADANDLLYVMASDEDVSTHENSGLMAIALSTMTNNYYGWYWCGGVYPVEYVASAVVADTFITDDSLVAGTAVAPSAGTETIDMRANPTDSQCPETGITLIGDGA